MTAQPGRQSRLGPLGVALVIGLAAGPEAASAADRATCKVITGLLNAIDKGLEANALGQASRSPANGIATHAQQAEEFAARFSTRDPLPDEVSAALSAIAEAAAAHVFIAEAVPVVLEPALVLQRAMPQICNDAEVPDLARHGSG